MDAWDGHRRFALGLEPDAAPVSRAEAADLDERLAGWRRSGQWDDDHD